MKDFEKFMSIIVDTIH